MTSEEKKKLLLKKNNFMTSQAKCAIHFSTGSGTLPVIKEAESKGLQQVLTNGSSFRRKIIIPVMPSHSQKYSNPKEVILRLAEGKLAIIAEGASNLHFSLDLCEDKVVRVRHGGEHKSIKEASELLMRPLLFPELFTQQ